VHQRFKELLHQYKLDVFRMQHDKKNVEQITTECMTICEDVLNQKYRYHFHKLPDANRAEIINMISNYTREALLPPVVEQLVLRQVTLEHRVEALEKFLEQMLDTLSTNPVSAG
jgi:ferric iron reductase protein FhuF